ncbi:hypothetical protein [Desulfovibrio ferrophilus]|uniref:DUF4412 domain-containing protein n=1 Tax=Desulfovibrio ferrophilus TaxID=241368 RepID=A0A2Z6B1M7_9BACT|nr:hypothetical protein [Desulfovibrio ferrophilus]BBD09427.1 uncharacterized protein DFE_2701 [Desulfovibrio ferrophilus]
MRHILSLLILALCVLYASAPAQAFSGQSVRLMYEERTGDVTSTKEYLVEKTPSGYRIVLFNQGIKRVIVTDDDLDTQVEDFDNPATGDHLTFRREDGGLRLTGTLDNKPMDKSFEADGLWYGSVLLLRDAVLAGKEKSAFIVTKPEEERVITLVAIRQETETLMIGGKPCETVKYKYTVPGFQGLFWKSYYWYRTSDGLLVKTEETRGMPGTAKVYSELKAEAVLPQMPAVAQLP